MAARCPFAAWKPLGTQTEPAMTAHDLLILHTMVGYLSSTDRYFRQEGYGGPESHYGVGGKWGPDADAGLDGTLYQWQDRARQADANVAANPRAISIETGDNAAGRAADIPPWTAAQQATIVRLLAWESSRAAHAGCPSSWRCHAEGIPLVLVPDSKPGRRGVAYHRQGIDPWRATGGELWSGAYGKECPAPARIAQVSALIERARALAGGGISLADADTIMTAIGALRHDLTEFGTLSLRQTTDADAEQERQMLAKLDLVAGNTAAALNQLGAIAAAVTSLAEQVAALAAGVPVPAPAGAWSAQVSFAAPVTARIDSITPVSTTATAATAGEPETEAG